MAILWGERSIDWKHTVPGSDAAKRVVIPCQCTKCRLQYLPYKGNPNEVCPYEMICTNAEASLDSKLNSEYIKERITVIRDVMSRSGRTVQERWTKMSIAKRKELLLKVDPGIYPYKYSTLEVSLDMGQDIFAERYHKVFSLLYLNLETLSTDGNKMIQLLHYRTDHEPMEWVTFDNQQLLLAWLYGAFREGFAHGSVIMQGEEYGKWQPFNQDDVHNGKSWGFPRASLILQAQYELMQFLTKFIFEVTATPSLREGNGTRYNMTEIAGEPSPIVELEYSRVDHQDLNASFGSTYSQTPFSAPPKFDLILIDQLIDTAESKLAEAQDHLCLLQSDPDYFYDFLSYWTKDNICRSIGPTFTEEDERKYVVGNLIYAPFFRCKMWQLVVEECGDVRREYLNCVQGGRDIPIGQALPRRYDKALGCLMALLMQSLGHLSREIAQLIFIAPGFKHKWEHVKQEEGSPYCFQLKKGRNTNKELLAEDPIFYCLKLFRELEGDYTFVEVLNLLSFLDDHLAKCTRAEAGRLGQITYDWISNLATMHHILQTVRAYAPAFNHDVSIEDAIAYKDTPAWRFWGNGRRIHESILESTFGSHSGLIDNIAKFRMPTGKKSRDWLQRADTARHQVSRVWMVYRSKYAAIFKSSGVEACIVEEMEALMSYDQTPEYTDVVERERTQIWEVIEQSEKKRLSLEAQRSEPVSSFIPYGNATPPRQRLPSVSRADKVKTRGTSVRPENLAMEPEAGPLQPPPKPSYLLRKHKSMKTIRLLFPPWRPRTTLASSRGTSSKR